MKKKFCCSLEALATAEKLKCCIRHCFKINGKQKIKMP